MEPSDASPAAVREATIRVERILYDTASDTSTHRFHSRLDEATHKLTLAYAAYTLFYALLRTCGKATSHHRVKEELSRVKHYMIKLKKVGDELRDRGDTLHHMPWTHTEPVLRLNAAAARRIVNSALAANAPSPADQAPPVQQRPTHPDASKKKSASSRSSSHRSDAAVKLKKRRNHQRDGQRLVKKARKTKLLKGH